jgi:hypothetical protein
MECRPLTISDSCIVCRTCGCSPGTFSPFYLPLHGYFSIFRYRGLVEAFYRIHELQRSPETPDSSFIELAPGRPSFRYPHKEAHPFKIVHNPKGGDEGNKWLMFHFDTHAEYVSIVW